jgi:hypothetical protein
VFVTFRATVSSSAPATRLASPQATLPRVANSRPSSDICQAIGSPTEPPARWQREPEQAAFPADPDRARAVLVPHLVGHDGDMLELSRVELSPASVRRISTSDGGASPAGPKIQVARRRCGASQATIRPPALPSNWYVPPSGSRR